MVLVSKQNVKALSMETKHTSNPVLKNNSQLNSVLLAQKTITTLLDDVEQWYYENWEHPITQEQREHLAGYFEITLKEITKAKK